MKLALKAAKREMPGSTNAAFSIFSNERIGATCSCLAEKALADRPPREAKMIASFLSVQFSSEMQSKLLGRSYGKRMKEARSPGEKTHLQKQRKNAKTKLRDQSSKAYLKAVSKSGMNRKKASHILQQATVSGAACMSRLLSS